MLCPPSDPITNTAAAPRLHAALRPGCLARSLQQLARRPVSSELRTSGLSSRPVRPSHPRRHLCEVGWRRERMQCGLTNSINELGRPPTASHSTVPSARELHLTRQLNLGVSGLHPNLKKFRMQSGVDVAARPSLADGDPHQAAAATQLCWPGDPNLQEAKQISSAFGLLDAALSLESEERERRAATRVAAFSRAPTEPLAEMPAPTVAAKLTTLQAASVAKPIFTDIPCWGAFGAAEFRNCVGQGQHQVKPVPHFDYVRVDLIDLQHAFRARTKTGIRLADNSNGSCLLHFSVSAPGPSAVLPVFQLRLRKAGGHGSLVQQPRKKRHSSPALIHRQRSRAQLCKRRHSSRHQVQLKAASLSFGEDAEAS
ncbi:histone deacetylase complex, SIN3 component [Moesziomyces antarcticus T-34]|uniref:Histone deacetylase complex, SIN3 component n=1 Tax=Pseudozyma antarctica (strain T-34) TaxID=1151754 RepID=M9MH40_PSEA3|nr:histone deacetylase complex, SIN3 component [Moesziomyces antarcticus T-34]